VLLALFSVLVVVTATGEGAVRAWAGRPAGRAAEWTRSAVLLVVGMVLASGLALLVGAHRPKEWLHLAYGLLAFGLIPVADNAAAGLGSDRAKALARLGGGLTSLLVLLRLFQTG